MLDHRGRPTASLTLVAGFNFTEIPDVTTNVNKLQIDMESTNMNLYLW